VNTAPFLPGDPIRAPPFLPHLNMLLFFSFFPPPLVGVSSKAFIANCGIKPSFPFSPKDGFFLPLRSLSFPSFVGVRLDRRSLSFTVKSFFLGETAPTSSSDEVTSPPSMEINWPSQFFLLTPLSGVPEFLQMRLNFSLLSKNIIGACPVRIKDHLSFRSHLLRPFLKLISQSPPEQAALGILFFTPTRRRRSLSLSFWWRGGGGFLFGSHCSSLGGCNVAGVSFFPDTHGASSPFLSSFIRMDPLFPSKFLSVFFFFLSCLLLSAFSSPSPKRVVAPFFVEGYYGKFFLSPPPFFLDLYMSFWDLAMGFPFVNNSLFLSFFLLFTRSHHRPFFLFLVTGAISPPLGSSPSFPLLPKGMTVFCTE